MTRFLIIAIISLFSISAVWAQKSTSAEVRPAEEENSLIWEISGKGMDRPSFLFGTIHMINKSDFILTPVTKTSFEKTEQVAFEIDMEEMTDFSVLMPLMMKAFMAGDTTLSDLLSEEDYIVVKNHFEKMGLPLVFLERIKPMFLSALASDDLLSTGDSQDEMMSYELELMTMAQQQNKEISGLETAEFQMSMFDSIPYKVQAEMLIQSIQSSRSGENEFQQLVELYKNQDLKKLQEVLSSDSEGIGRYEDLLLVRRNKNWIPVMETMMQKAPTFFAVGAGHLGGPNGVITLLRQAGYTMTPLK